MTSDPEQMNRLAVALLGAVVERMGAIRQARLVLDAVHHPDARTEAAHFLSVHGNATDKARAAAELTTPKAPPCP